MPLCAKLLIRGRTPTAGASLVGARSPFNHPNSHKNTQRRGVPCGRPVALQRRITCFNCRSFSPIGRPQGTPLRWVCLVCAFDFMHEIHEIYDVWIFNTMHRERKNIVLFVCSCRNENILIIRCHPNSLKNTHRRGVPRGRPVALQRRIHCFKCRSFSPIGRPRGTPLRWENMAVGMIADID